MELIGLGALNMDYLYRVERILGDGEAVADEPQAYPGGSAANTIYGLARLGVQTGFISAVGDDPDGAALVTDFKKVGVDTSRIKVKSARTGYTLCLSDRSGRRSLYVVPGANNHFTLDEADVLYIKQARMLHVSSFAGEQQFRLLLDLMDRLGAAPLLSFAPGAIYAGKGLKNLAPILVKTHVLVINRSEIRELTGEDFAAGAGTCIRSGCRIVAVTLGKGVDFRGKDAAAYIRDPEQEYVVEPSTSKQTRELETTGAGDAFAAGFLYGLLKDKSPDECGRLGNIVAQFSIKEIGARAGLPTLVQLSERYRELYNRVL